MAILPCPRARALASPKEAVRAAPFEYVVPSFIDGDVEMEPEVGESGKALIARRAPPPPGRPMFAAMRLLKVKAALFDSLKGRPGEKELESWVRRKEAEVIGQAGLSCMAGRWAGACWARRKANLSGLSEGGTSVRWVAAGAAVGLRAELEGEYVRVEARAWASEFDEPFRLVKTSLGRVELPDFRFSSTGGCSARLKLGEEGVVGAAALDDGMMLLLTAKVGAVSK